MDRGGPLPVGTVTPSLQLARKSLLIGIVDLESEVALRERVARWSSADKPRHVPGAGPAGDEHSISTSGQKGWGREKRGAKRAKGAKGSGKGAEAQGKGTPKPATLWRVKLNLGKTRFKFFPKSTHTLEQVKAERDAFCAEEVLRLRAARAQGGHCAPALPNLSNTSLYRKKRVGMPKKVGSERASAKVWRTLESSKPPRGSQRAPEQGRKRSGSSSSCRTDGQRALPKAKAKAKASAKPRAQAKAKATAKPRAKATVTARLPVAPASSVPAQSSTQMVWRRREHSEASLPLSPVRVTSVRGAVGDSQPRSARRSSRALRGDAPREPSGGPPLNPRQAAGSRFDPQEVAAELQLRTLPNEGQGNCFPLALDGATGGRVRADTVRTRMQQYVQQHPNAQCVRALPQADRVGFDRDRAWITDARARLVAVACAMDIFIFDLPNQCIRYICHGEGAVRYPSRRVSINMLRTRIGDQRNPSCMLRYSAGHYEALVKH